MNFTIGTTVSRLSAGLVLAAGLAACGHVDKYEAGVIDYEPTYCYAALGGAVECYREPVPGEERRLVNYYGKHPSRYDKPAPPPEPEYKAPPKVATWVKDPEPVVRAMPKGDLADRPWLQPGYTEPVAQHASPQATRAFLRQAHENLTRSIEADSRERRKALSDGAAGTTEDGGSSEGWPESSLAPDAPVSLASATL